MTKKQLVSYLAKHCSLPLATSRLVVNTLADVATKELKAGRGFSIHGFGSLEPWYQSARPGRNIRAELPCMIAPRISVKFKPGVYLLAALNNNVLAEENPDTGCSSYRSASLPSPSSGGRRVRRSRQRMRTEVVIGCQRWFTLTYGIYQELILNFYLFVMRTKNYHSLGLLAAALVCVAVLFTGCRSSKKIVYLQDVVPLKQQEIEQKYEVFIHNDDLLSIMVNSKNPELALPFNMPLVSYQLGSESPGAQRVLGYLVDVNGNIDFPILGKLHVAGLTRLQLTEMIKERLISEDLIKDPIVTVQFLNYKISVMGEVSRPGSFNISSDWVTLLEALIMAGDLTIYGRRDRVAVIREKDGKRTILFHDLRSSDIFNSPCYYLQQNDIVYVEPNKVKAEQSGINQNKSVGVWLSAASILVSIASLVVTLTK